MPLRVKDPAPDFSLPSTSGKTFNLRQNVENNPIVLYFYPKDFTPACTREACSFRDEFSAFKNLKVTVVGISRDTLETHHK
ncbi:MAG: redoxin domain-containing protein, partial [Cyclobacteriaceae bacterium]